MTDLATLAARLKKLSDQEKDIKAEKDGLRSELFNYGAKDYEGKEYLLPTTTITVPKIFWHTTGFTEFDFIRSRFPTWDIEVAEYDDLANTTTFVLRKNPLYAPFKYEDDALKLSKSVTEPTPEIDFESLKAERPDLFDKITKEVISLELDGEALEAAIAEDQEVVSILTRHTKYTREPQQRVAIKEL